MCGIAGTIDFSARSGEEALSAIARRMERAIEYRGPDDEGVWVDAEAGVAFGHRRLSILDLSPLGHQPMHSKSGRYTIVFNGEIYNFQKLRDELAKSGAAFAGHSDTEVMLAAFESWGVEGALRRFNGMFAFALWDGRERELYLARDRMGEKPLYYGWAGQEFVFASELKALRAHPRFESRIDREAVASYARFNYVPAPRSIYESVWKLIPGTFLKVGERASRASMPHPLPYWSAKEAAERGVREPFAGGDADAERELEALLSDSVRLRMVSDVPLGAFLSGGIDSSTVVALMQRQSRSPIKTFTIGFEEQAYDEAVHAKAVARHLGTDHTELYLRPGEALDLIPRLPLIYDEPFSDSSQIPTYLVSRLARKQVTVALSGDGGDELFGGYNRYHFGTKIWERVKKIPVPLRKAASQGLLLASPRSWENLFRGVDPVLPKSLKFGQMGYKIQKVAEALGAKRADELYLGLVSNWKDPSSLVIGAAEAPSPASEPESWPALDGFQGQMMYLDAVSYLPDDILTKLDRASMAVSLESRVPLLDHRVFELAWRLPISMKIRGGVGKWLLRQVLYKYVPSELVERPKSGFAIPLDSWLRGPLREWVESLIGEERLTREGYFHPAAIRKIWGEHRRGERDWQYRIWNIAMFQAWLER